MKTLSALFVVTLFATVGETAPAAPQPNVIYKDKPWSEPARRYAAMVTLVDRQVGEVLALLKELGIEQNTLVFFSGDNGGNDYFKSAEHPRGVHLANKHPPTRASPRIWPPRSPRYSQM